MLLRFCIWSIYRYGTHVYNILQKTEVQFYEL
jgi:hypothetical protein